MLTFRRLTGAAFAVVVSAIIATGCSFGGIPGDAICKVQGEGIAKTDFNRIIKQAKTNYTSQKQKFPKKSSEEYKQLTKQAVSYLVEQKLYEKKAEDLGIKISDKEVTKRLKQIVKSYFKGNKKEYKAALKKQGLSEADVRNNIKQQALSEKLFNKVTKDIKASKKEAKKRYDENPSQYQTPESREVAHILVKTKAQADKLYAQVKANPKVFGSLAKKFSQDPSSASQNGELTVTKGQTVPEFDAISFDKKLAVGTIKAPVKTQFGFHIIMIKGAIKPAVTQEFKDVESQIKQTIEQEERGKAMQDWRKALLKKAEKDVDCKAGYVWTQTAKSGDSAAEGEKPPKDAKPPSDKDSKKSDKKKSDKKNDD